MSHYFDDHTYTTKQAKRAQSVVLGMIRKRRFFLYDPNRELFYKRDYGLDPEVFGEAISLDTKLKSLYSGAKKTAIESIKSGEQDLGITPPDMKNNRQLVVCNRYSGGFEILRVYPLVAFAPFAPKTKKDLVADLLKLEKGEKTKSDFSPKQLSAMTQSANALADKIWGEFQVLQIFDPENAKCLLMLGSRVNCGGSDKNGDFAEGVVQDLQNTPHALGYLFYKFSQNMRIVQHDHVVFGTSCESHVNVQHWSDSTDDKKGPKICFYSSDGYNCSVVFVTAI
jgi:hypothetical protein